MIDLGLSDSGVCDMEKDFKYTKESDCVEIEGYDDVDELFNTQEYLEKFRIKEDK